MAVKRWRVLGSNPEAGITDWFGYDHATGESIIYRTQDVANIAEIAKAERNQNDERKRHGDGMEHYMHIPDVVMAEMWKRGINLYKDRAALRRFINDPDNAWMRSRRGYA